MLTASSTRDLVRFRALKSPILELASSFLSVLSASTPQGSTLRLAFLPALLGTDLRPKDPTALQTADERLRVMTVATLAHELAQWIYVQTHGRQNTFLSMDDGGSMHTTDTRGSVSSFGSSAIARPKNRQDVGDKAVISLFGCDFELLSYTIG
ncbi:hypothetical protein RQP46_002283 [Phenoliferia psychrophenolica]